VFNLFLALVISTLLLQLAMIKTVSAKQYSDPTRPPGVSQKQLNNTVHEKKTSWRLSSTLIASERKIATVNGKLVRPGDRVNGAVLIDIQAWNVTLKKNDKLFKVYMFNKKKIHKINR